MGLVYEFVVRSEPRPQPRVRAARVGGKIRMYTPSTASLYKAAVQAAIREAVPFNQSPIDSAVVLSGEFVMKRPKKMKKSDISPPHTAKPDLDNLIKSTQDAMVDAGILRDDCIISGLDMKKRYAALEEAPHVRIVLSVENPENEDKM
jgi:Holliday junction resolvase RusA-like endonuclease